MKTQAEDDEQVRIAREIAAEFTLHPHSITYQETGREEVWYHSAEIMPLLVELSALRDIERVKGAGAWIFCRDRLPVHEQEVLVHTKRSTSPVLHAQYQIHLEPDPSQTGFHSYGGLVDEPICWMPIPMHPIT